MIRFWPENNKPGNTMPVEKAKGQVVAMPEMATPETLMPVKVRSGKIIEWQGQLMLRRKCLHQGTGRERPRYRNVMMKLILEWKESELTGTHWENVLEKDACQTGMRGTG
jgi:hypothetical protein